MKKSIGAVCLAGALAFAVALPSINAQDAPSRPSVDMASLTFADHMSMTGRTLRTIKRAVRKLDDPASRQRALDAVQILQEHMVAAKKKIDQAPMSEYATNEFGDDTDAYHTSFRRHMVDAIEATLELELGILAKDADAVAKALEHIEEEEHHSHDEFQVRE